MRILLTNDDGVMAEGIRTLAKALQKKHEVIIVAPEKEMSAQSHSITLFKPLVIKKIELEGIEGEVYSVAGTPADCVRAGIEVLVEEPIDFVCSGINIGLNAGMDVLYSGTVSAAIEASIYNLPSMAISTEYVAAKVNFSVAAKHAVDILERSIQHLIGSNMVLNVNVPYTEKDVKGIEVCRVGDVINDYYIIGENGDGERYMQTDSRREVEFTKDTDRYFLREGYVTVTPLHYDLTNFKTLEAVKEWLGK